MKFFYLILTSIAIIYITKAHIGEPLSPKINGAIKKTSALTSNKSNAPKKIEFQEKILDLDSHRNLAINKKETKSIENRPATNTSHEAIYYQKHQDEIRMLIDTELITQASAIAYDNFVDEATESSWTIPANHSIKKFFDSALNLPDLQPSMIECKAHTCLAFLSIGNKLNTDDAITRIQNEYIFSPPDLINSLRITPKPDSGELMVFFRKE